MVPSAASQAQPRTQHTQLAATTVTSQPIARTWTPPDLSKIPAGPDGESILLGMHIFEETPRYAPNYVGNQLSCGSCHLAGGTMSYGIALVGAPSWFPMYSDRAKRDITLEDRIQECVTRSENGTPLPQGGREVTALISYMTWISQQGAAEGITPVRGVDAKIPDAPRRRHARRSDLQGAVLRLPRRRWRRRLRSLASAVGSRLLQQRRRDESARRKWPPSSCTTCRRTIRESSRRKKPGTSRPT